jgi:hypothetical protein
MGGGVTDDIDDIVERLLACQGILSGDPECCCKEAATKIKRLHAEVAEWKERWAAERRDHEATIRHFDTLMNEVTLPTATNS